ncbi:Fucose permease [Ruminococcus sp. YE71]|uniref:MFS transporter n=1 Tax=unclassified Ruminococcus TaxID=2608920 RepID=UPI00088C4799|nr:MULTISPECIES: MFS transporter [unclassified Ruminococcus]SDA12512.1 Fucose permease [Ruminococcus sp. YE78]SFW17055.1 Fucose permease [Ruminococcus sp. YE71]
MEKKSSRLTAMLFCGIVMTITAASDALRGVFLPQFRSAFSLTEPQSGRIIMVSYIGNLLFLSVGGYLSDRLPRKRFIGGVLLLWSAALATYVFTENYYILLAAMMFSMGGSTMISTSVNIITPMLFAPPALYVNLFNFLQGVGIFTSQNVGGRFAEKMSAWHGANAILLTAALVSFALLMTMKLPDPEKPQDSKKSGGYIGIIKDPATLLLILVCGCYFIAEHGLMNWLTSYGSVHLGFTVQKAAMYLSLFYGGLTVARLILAPFIDRVGVFRMLLICSAAGAVLHSLGVAFGKSGLLFFGASGLAFSVIYPLLVMLIGSFYDPSQAGTATGFVLSVATFFDIGFNAFFGGLVEKAGYGKAMIVLPVCAVLMAAFLYVLKFCVKRSKDIR